MSILNLTAKPVSPSMRSAGVFDLPDVARSYLERLHVFEKPPTSWEIRERAREITVLAIHCSSPEGRRAVNTRQFHEDEGKTATSALIDGPPWFTTILAEELMNVGLTPLYSFGVPGGKSPEVFIPCEVRSPYFM